MAVDARRSPLGAPKFSYSGSELDALAEAKNYYRWLTGQFAPWLGSSVIEVGAGIGTFSQQILGVPSVKRLVALEPARNTFPHLERRFADDPRVTTTRAYLEPTLKLEPADSLVAVNVMEHIEDHDSFVANAYASVVKGGALLLYVPATPSIFGTLDTAFGHFRRYTKRSLRACIERAGWTIEQLSYVNMPGVLAWFLAGRVLKKKAISTREAIFYDRLVVPWVFRLESIAEPPAGQSLIAIASKQ